MALRTIHSEDRQADSAMVRYGGIARSNRVVHIVVFVPAVGPYTGPLDSIGLYYRGV